MRTSTQNTYDVFRQRVRRFRRSDLLKAVASEAIVLHRQDMEGGPEPRLHDAVQHFSLAGVAIAALRYGNDYREPGVTRTEVAQLCSLYVNIHEPALDHQPIDLRGLMHRMAYEQFPYQISLMEELGRTVALFLDEGKQCDEAPSEGAWTSALSVSLRDFVAIGFALHVAALRGDGVIRRSDLRSADWASVWNQLDSGAGVDAVMVVVDKFFAQSVADVTDVPVEADPGLERWAFNPLVAKPLIELGADQLLAPQPRLLLHRISPTGLYFTGLNAFGSKFPDTLGCLFESYVGTQLRALGMGRVIPEITFGKSERKTVDWFLVLDDLVLLVEAKAYRPIEGARLGVADGDDDLLKKVGKAMRQLQRTYELIRDKHPAVSQIPNDRPVAGLVVTLEPFHLVNTLIWDKKLPACDIPVAVSSIHELEGFIGAARNLKDLGQRLKRALQPPPPYPPSLSAAVEDATPTPNPILAASWARLPWGN